MVVRFEKKKSRVGGLNLQELISNGIGPLAFNSPFDNLACLRSKFKMIDFFSHSNLQIVSYAAKWLPGVRIPVV